MSAALTPTEQLAGLRPGTRELAEWRARQRFCEHGNRALFAAELQAIRDCRLIDFQEHREKTNAA